MEPKKLKAFVAGAICDYLSLIDDIDDNTFKKLFPFVDINNIPDRILIKNNRIRENANWNALNKYKLIRILVRDLDLLEKIDITKYDFNTMDLYPLFIVQPELVDYFNIDFASLSKFEAIKMLECSSDFVERLDISNYSFSKNEMTFIIKKFSNNEKIMEHINFEDLDHFILRKLLIKTGTKYVDKINLSFLKATDWLDVLRKKPELIEHCNLLLFEKNDCYLLVKLVEMFPELEYLIEENQEKISALGWEKLVLFNLKKFGKYCKWEKLSKKNWDNIVERHPNLENFKRKYVF